MPNKKTGNKVVYGRKQWKSSRKDTGNKQKYMLVLDKKIREKIEDKKVSNERVKVIEMDELYTYTERKKQNLRDNTSK